MWGNAKPKIRPLRYEVLKQAIAKKGNRGHVGRVKVGHNVWARIDGDDIVLRLHRTDIITYHPDGSRTLYADGWDKAPITRHWFSCAGLHLYSLRLNKWTGTVTVLGNRQYGTWVKYGLKSWVKFYDGMKVDAAGLLISPPQPITKRVPNAEAKAMRKQMFRVFNNEYLPHLRFIDSQDPQQWREAAASYMATHKPHYPQAAAFSVGVSTDDVLRLIYTVITEHCVWRYLLPSKCIRRILDNQYEKLVKQRDLFDKVPYLPTKEN